MIILDTNVISSLMRTVPEPVVVSWLDQQATESVWITSITVLEVGYGLGLLPNSKRRREMETGFRRLLTEDLQDRILDFDHAAANEAAALAVKRRLAGRTVDMRDTQIAGIAQNRRATLATRNVKHFSDLSCPVVNPWGKE